MISAASNANQTHKLVEVRLWSSPFNGLRWGYQISSSRSLKQFHWNQCLVSIVLVERAEMKRILFLTMEERFDRFPCSTLAPRLSKNQIENLCDVSINIFTSLSHSDHYRTSGIKHSSQTPGDWLTQLRLVLLRGVDSGTRERETRIGNAWFVSSSVRFPLSSMKKWRTMKVAHSLQVMTRLFFSFIQNDRGID